MKIGPDEIVKRLEKFLAEMIAVTKQTYDGNKREMNKDLELHYRGALEAYEIVERQLERLKDKPFGKFLR